ncbi:cytochrome C [Thermomonas aquatica]|jgi:mono/diheme cytochrome c family protein|nr:cytochrome C [Thermomonas aquatica]
MMRSACLSLAILGLAACSAPDAIETSAQAPVAGPSDAELLARGDYLVRIAGCNDCHTPAYGERGGNVPKQEWLVGSPLGFNGPWGTTYAANLRIKAAEMDEAGWLKYTGALHTRPLMPDFALRAMCEDDRRAIYRFIRSLGAGGAKAPDYLPPGKAPPLPYMQMVLPPMPQPAAAAAPEAG